MNWRLARTWLLNIFAILIALVALAIVLPGIVDEPSVPDMAIGARSTFVRLAYIGFALTAVLLVVFGRRHSRTLHVVGSNRICAAGLRKVTDKRREL
jgi:hypothetical protein